MRYRHATIELNIPYVIVKLRVSDCHLAAKAVEIGMMIPPR